jgi:hypothetical protein
MATLCDRHPVTHRVPSVNHPAATMHRNIKISLINSPITNQAGTPRQRTHTSLGTFFVTHQTAGRTLADHYQFLLRFGDGGKFTATLERGNCYDYGGRI